MFESFDEFHVETTAKTIHGVEEVQDLFELCVDVSRRMSVELQTEVLWRALRSLDDPPEARGLAPILHERHSDRGSSFRLACEVNVVHPASWTNRTKGLE
jgi:hypothetical protein